MPLHFSRRAPVSETLAVRRATQADRGALSQLTERARRTHFHLDGWTLDDWVAYPSSNAWVAMAGRQFAGVLIAPEQDVPVAWARLVSIADGFDARAVLDTLWPAAVEGLRAANVQSLACLSYPEWLAKLLPDAGFRPFTDVAHFRKSDWRVPDYGSASVTVRPARRDDLPVVLANDRAAFDPVWWHTLDSLKRILGDCAHFSLAELDGRKVGHAFSDLYGERGHIIRLAVHPNAQGRGIGARLLADALTFLLAAGAHPITLNTQVDNYTSQSLYRRFGFAPTGESTLVMLRDVTRELNTAH